MWLPLKRALIYYVFKKNLLPWWIVGDGLEKLNKDLGGIISVCFVHVGCAWKLDKVVEFWLEGINWASKAKASDDFLEIQYRNLELQEPRRMLVNGRFLWLCWLREVVEPSSLWSAIGIYFRCILLVNLGQQCINLATFMRNWCLEVMPIQGGLNLNGCM
jgi:hypothetical protein